MRNPDSARLLPAIYGALHALVDATTVTVVFRACRLHDLDPAVAFALVVRWEFMKSNRSNRLLIAGFSLIALVWSGPVGADITPPPGWVEECTLAKQQGRTETCVESPIVSMGDPHVLMDTRGNPAGSREAYFRKLEAEGYVFRCRTGTSGSFWTEIWCKPDKLKMRQHPIATFFGAGRGTLIALSSAAVLAGAIAVLAIRRRKNQP